MRDDFALQGADAYSKQLRRDRDRMMGQREFDQVPLRLAKRDREHGRWRNKFQLERRVAAPAFHGLFKFTLQARCFQRRLEICASAITRQPCFQWITCDNFGT